MEGNNQPGRMRGQHDADVIIPKIAEFVSHISGSWEESNRPSRTHVTTRRGF